MHSTRSLTAANSSGALLCPLSGAACTSAHLFRDFTVFTCEKRRKAKGWAVKQVGMQEGPGLTGTAAESALVTPCKSRTLVKLDSPTLTVSDASVY